MKRQVMNVLVCIFLCGVIGNVDAYASPAASAIAKMKEAAEQQEEVQNSIDDTFDLIENQEGFSRGTTGSIGFGSDSELDCIPITTKSYNKLIEDSQKLEQAEAKETKLREVLPYVRNALMVFSLLIFGIGLLYFVTWYHPIDLNQSAEARRAVNILRGISCATILLFLITMTSFGIYAYFTFFSLSDLVG